MRSLNGLFIFLFLSLAFSDQQMHTDIYNYFDIFGMYSKWRLHCPLFELKFTEMGV